MSVRVNKRVSFSQFTRAGALLVSILFLAGCVIQIDPDDWDYGHSYDHHDGHGGHNINKVFGSVDVDEGLSVGNVESVNGGITLQDNSSARQVSVVNGSVRVHDDVSVYSVETVNGNIRAGVNFKVEGDITTVNGGIELRKGTLVSDDVTTVNGTIRLQSTSVGNDVSTVNGDIILRNSNVSGDVVFEENRGFFNGQRDGDNPRLIVDANSTISGVIHLYRKVDLEIDEAANVGEIIEHF